ncbi:MAG: glycosyltransferase [Chlorobiaceae bacterium]|nr:glycosyltransferase [Chlorobiaceae bacterium]
MRERAFICDPVCALPYGHNVVGLKYFSEASKPFYNTIIPIASTCLPEDIALKYGFERGFEFYYYNHINIDPINKIPSAHSLSSDYDLMIELAIQDMSTIYEKYVISENDALFFPCVDYYGAMAILELLYRISPPKTPFVYFRFIGVMENATSIGLSGLPKLLKDIKKMLAAGYKIKLCAETPRYADSLASDLATFVNVVPYPTHTDMIKKLTIIEGGGEEYKDIFTVVCPGSARCDKGYLDLFDIFSTIRKIDPRQSIKFVVQGLPVADSLQHTSYTNQLYAIPGVKILHSTLSEEEMNELYSLSDLVLLPYDTAIYAFRGSAVFMECISRGIPVIALAGSAFCDQIIYYGAGSVVPEIGSFANEILQYRYVSKPTLITKMYQARHRYSIDADYAFIQWMTP